MRNLLFILGLTSIALLIQSCSNTEFASHIHKRNLIKTNESNKLTYTRENNLKSIPINQSENITQYPKKQEPILLEASTKTKEVLPVQQVKQAKVMIKNNVVPNTYSSTKESKWTSRKEVRNQLKQFKRDYSRGLSASDASILLIVILAILLPPVGVLVYDNLKVTTAFWISLLLTLLFFLPGAIFSVLYVLGLI